MPAHHRPGARGPDLAAEVPLIGRDRELSVLRAALQRAAAHDPAAVAISGLPGMGKSRLAAEALRLAAAAGFQTLVGHTDELGRDSAYAPVVEALGPWLHRQPASRLHQLVADLPALALVFAGLPVAAPPPLADPALERARMQEAFTRLIARMADEHPLALLLEDLHAADADTIALTRHVAAALADRPALLIGTTRTSIGHADAGHADTGRADTGRADTGRADTGQATVAWLSAALAGLGWHVDQLTLEPLDAEATGALLAAQLGAPVSAQTAAAVAERCAGRPLFIRAVATTLATGGRLARRHGRLQLDEAALPLPERVRSYLAARLVRRSDAEWSVLTRLAVARAAVDTDIVLAAVGRPADATLDALERLERDGLVCAGDDTGNGGSYRLVHGLLRDTVLADASPTAVRRAHADLARSYLNRQPADHRIAEHVLQAGPLLEGELAMRALEHGAVRAGRLGAVADAERFLAEAVHRARALPEPATAGPGTVAALLAQLAEAQRTGSGAAAARRNWLAARDAYADAGDPVGVARAERTLASLDWSAGELAAAGARFDAADRLLAEVEPGPEHGELLHARLTAALRTNDMPAVQQLAEQLSELAGRLGTSSLLARAQLARAVLAHRARDYAAMAAANRLALAAAEAAGDLELTMRAHDQLAIGAASEGDIDGLRQHSRAGLALARAAGTRMLEPWPRVRIAVADLLAGDWDAALRGTSEVLSFAGEVTETRGMVSVSALHAWMLAWRGRLADAQQYLDDALRLAPALRADRNIFGVVEFAGLVLAAARDQPALAADTGARLASLTDGWFPLLAAAELGEAEVLAGRLDRAEALVTRIADVRTRRTRLPQVLGDWITGLAHAREPDGLVRLDAAAAGWRELGLPFHAARADLAFAVGAGRADAALGRAGEARDRAAAALSVFDRLGAPRQAEQARRLLRDLGVVAAPGQARARSDIGLSPRELEVAQHVAAGRSNADIAVELFISPRTVTTHLQHIYARLGLSSRVALTRYLVDSGQLGTTSPAQSQAR